MSTIIYAGFPSAEDARLAGMSPEWKIYPATNEGRKQLIADGYRAVSIYEFDHAVEAGKPKPVVYGDILLDFDAKKYIHHENGINEIVGDIEKSLKALKTFIHILIKNFDISPNELLIWASGGKGFHLAIPRELIGSQNGDCGLPMIYKEMIRNIISIYNNKELWDGAVHEALQYSQQPNLEDFCIDNNTFKGGRGQLIRLAHFQRLDGNYKVPVTYNELIEYDEEYFRSIVKSDRSIPGEYEIKELKVNPGLEKLFLEKKDFIRKCTPLHKRHDVDHARALETECVFLTHCRDDALALSYAEWFTMARILAQCGALGKYLFHEYSKLDPKRYDYKKCQNIIIDTYKYGAPTCKEVKQLYACNKKCGVKCPIDLFAKANSKSIGLNKFLNTHEGLYYIPNAEDKTEREKICSSLEIMAQARDDKSSSWAKIVEFQDPDGSQHVSLIPNTSLIGKAEDALSSLVNEGLYVEPGIKAKNLVVEYLQLSMPAMRGKILEKNGWANDDFKAYIPFDLGCNELGEEYLCKRDCSTDSPYAQAGTLQEWQDNIARPCQGSPLLRLAIIMGVAGPMLRLLNSGGFGMHLYGLTSTGKTTALRVGASVTGSPITKWKATDNALETVAEVYNDNTLWLDELNEIDPDALSYCAYMLPEGKGKLRNSKSGKNRRLITWNELFLSVGEVTIADRANEGRKNKAMGGHEVRFINIEADGGTGKGIFTHIPDGFDANRFSVYLCEASDKYKGTALLAFIGYIKKNKNRVLVQTNEFISEYLEQKDTSHMNGQTLRVLQNLSFLAGVGEFAISCGLLPWSKGDAALCIDFCFEKWRGIYSGGVPYEIQAAIKRLIDLIQEDFGNQINKFDLITSLNVNGRECYHISRSYIIFHICKELYYQKFVDRLLQMNVLILDKNGKPRNQSSLPGGRHTPRGICIDIKKLLFGDDCPEPSINKNNDWDKSLKVNPLFDNNVF